MRQLSVLHPALLGPIVDVDVRFVDDLLLDDLLNDVLEGDEADGLVERVTFAGSVDILEFKSNRFRARRYKCNFTQTSEI